MNKKGQNIGTIVTSGAVMIILVVVIRLVIALTDSMSTGNPEPIINVFIPLMIFALFFEVIRRILG